MSRTRWRVDGICSSRLIWLISTTTVFEDVLCMGDRHVNKSATASWYRYLLDPIPESAP